MTSCIATNYAQDGIDMKWRPHKGLYGRLWRRVAVAADILGVDFACRHGDKHS